MDKQKGIEVKVGIFVAAGLMFIMLAILILGGGQFLKSTYTYTSHFDNAEGLIPGAKVILSGINVGVVDAVDFDKAAGNVLVRISVSKNMGDWIREDSTAEIATQGVLGDKFISLKAGSPNQSILASGADIPARPTKDLSQFISRGDQLLGTLNRIALNLDRLFSAFEAENRSELFFKNMTNTTKNLAQLTDKLNQQLSDNRLGSVLNHLSQITQKIDNGTGTIGALINDPSLYDEIKALLGGANRNRIIRNIVRQTLESSKEKTSNPKSESVPSK